MSKQYTGVVIDYGHGGILDGEYQTPGGKQYTHTDASPPLFIGEGISNRMTAARLIRLLLDAGIPVVDAVAGRELVTSPECFHSLEQRDISLSARVAVANRYPSHLFVSLHSNAVGNVIRGASQSARGAVIYTSRGQTSSDTVATSLHNAFAEAFEGEPVKMRRGDFSDGDPDEESGFYVLRKTKGSAVLGEILFFTNLLDARYLLSSSGQDVIAGAYFNGIAPFLLS